MTKFGDTERCLSVGNLCHIEAENRIGILVVDDHPVLREGLNKLITGESDLTLVAEAENGKQAIELFELHKPDITLLDLRLPDISGTEVVRQIRARDPAAKVIILTTYQGDIQAMRAIQAGACGYLLKAMLRLDLLDAIRAVHAGQFRVPAEIASELAQHVGESGLTAREIEILQLVSKGCSNKIIAGKLSITEDTVKGHIRKILQKLKANDRAHAVTIAIKRGFFDL